LRIAETLLINKGYTNSIINCQLSIINYQLSIINCLIYNEQKLFTINY